MVLRIYDTSVGFFTIGIYLLYFIMETGDQITVEAEVHDDTQIGTRRSGRNASNNPPAPVEKVPKKRGPKPKQSNANTGKRMTVNALAVIVNDMQRANDARADTFEREMMSQNSVLKGLGEAFEKLASSLPANNNVASRADVLSQQTSVVAHTTANQDVARQPPQTRLPVHPHLTPGATQVGHQYVTPVAASAPPPPVHVHQAPAMSQTVQQSAAPTALPPPQVLVREENREGMLDRMITKEDYKSVSNHGKNNYNEMGMAKPYMFLYRSGLQTPKQKLDIRANLSMIEYVNCTLLLIQDPDAFSQEDLPHILAHLTAVTTDAMVRPWSTVRSWSQYIWDCVERGKCSWTSYQFIQDERVRMSFISGAPSGNTAGGSTTHKTGNNDAKVVLCRE